MKIWMMMTGSAERKASAMRIRSLLAAAAVPALVLALASCAPEPIAGAPEKGTDSSSTDGDWSETNDPNDPELKSVELPEGFPSDEFALPEGAVVDDAGERGGAWFVVLRAADEAQAETWWDEIVASNGFFVRDEEDLPDGGRAATLAAGTLAVQAVTVPQSDGSVLLSYDIATLIV
jgi:hypothetical protein